MIVLKIAALIVAGNIALIAYLLAEYLLEECRERWAIHRRRFDSQGRARLGL